MVRPAPAVVGFWVHSPALPSWLLAQGHLNPSSLLGYGCAAKFVVICFPQDDTFLLPTRLPLAILLLSANLVSPFWMLAESFCKVERNTVFSTYMLRFPMSPYILASSQGLSYEFQSMLAFQFWVLTGTKCLHVTSMLHYSPPGSATCRLDSSSTAWRGPSESPGGGSPMLSGDEAIADLPQRLPCALDSPHPLSTTGCLGGFLPSGTGLRAVNREYRESSCCVQLN